MQKDINNLHLSIPPAYQELGYKLAFRRTGSRNLSALFRLLVVKDAKEIGMSIPEDIKKYE
jgi:hypothetical protein